MSVTVAYTMDWPLSFISPLLAASILANPKPAPGLKETLAVLLAIAVIFAVGLWLTIFVYLYPAVFILFFSGALYLVFLASAQGRSSFVILLYLMALMMLPLLGSGSTETATTVSYGFLLSALSALVAVKFADLIFPVFTPAVESPTESADFEAAAGSAWLSLGVVLPAALLCLTFSLSGALLPLLMIAILSQKPDFSIGAAGGKGLIAANLLGGLTAVIFYQLILVTPTLGFTVLGIVGLALLFGRKIFSGEPMAPLWASGFTAFLVLIGSGTGAFGDEADAMFYQRIFQITLAVCYVVGALSLLQRESIRKRWLSVGRFIYTRLTPVHGKLHG